MKYIALQRTGYLTLQKNFLLRLLARVLLWPVDTKYRSVHLESFLRKKKIVARFNHDIFKEYEDIRPWLPKNASELLDIGCGIGGIDVLLFNHYKRDSTLKFYLLDKKQISEKIYYGFMNHGAGYNSLEITEAVLLLNGIKKENINLLEATINYTIAVPHEVDLVISLLSYGFHYPVSTYLNQVHQALRKGGHLILDIRNGTEGEQELFEVFSKLSIVSKSQKKVRYLAIK